MMTLMFVLGTGFGGVLSAFVCLAFKAREIHILKRQLKVLDRQLTSAEADVHIVRSLRSGELDPADLREIGLVPDAKAIPEKTDTVDARQWDLPSGAPGYASMGTLEERRASIQAASVRLAAMRARLDAAQRPPAPRFVPNVYTRTPKTENLAPGDEVWITDLATCDDGTGRPAILKGCDTHSHPSIARTLRIRVYTDGSLELGVYEGGHISSALPDEPVIPVARVRNLSTDEIRELR